MNAERGRPSSRSKASLRCTLALLVGSWLTPCGAPACTPLAEDSAALEELDRLAFVPAGQFTLATAIGNAVFQVREPLLMDRFEVQREDWLALRAATEPWPRELTRAVEGWDPKERHRPATFVTQREAQRFAQARGMRLPTAAEWIFASAGPQRLPFPWGVTAQKGVSNTLELGLGRLAPCGAFESGRSAHGLYDLHGNAAEWAGDLAPLRERTTGDERVSILGGSFRTYSRPLLLGDVEPFGRAAPPDYRADDLGFRCCANAAELLWKIAPRVVVDAGTRPRLNAIGRRWGRRALPLLSDLSARAGAPPALRALAEGANQ